MVTNSTYDGLCYNVIEWWNNLPDEVPRVHFDEAWYAYAKFHQLYRAALCNGRAGRNAGPPSHFLRAVDAQDAGRVLHGLDDPCQARLRAPLDFDQFNEAFMMHGTTSPFYPLIASLDVAAAMMDEPAGPTLMDETLPDAISFRKAMSSIAHRLRTTAENGDGWFFGIYQPERVTDPATGESILFEDAPKTNSWQPNQVAGPSSAAMNGTAYQDEDSPDDYCMLDPTKVTILTPGVNAQGVMSQWGIPAAILTEFLDSRRVEIARTGDYTVLVLFSVGTSKGKWGSLLENLFEFKRLYDTDASLEEALPELVQRFPHRYRNVSLRELSDEMHRR